MWWARTIIDASASLCNRSRIIWQGQHLNTFWTALKIMKVFGSVFTTNTLRVCAALTKYLRTDYKQQKSRWVSVLSEAHFSYVTPSISSLEEANKRHLQTSSEGLVLSRELSPHNPITSQMPHFLLQQQWPKALTDESGGKHIRLHYTQQIGKTVMIGGNRKEADPTLLECYISCLGIYQSMFKKIKAGHVPTYQINSLSNTVSAC